MVPEASRGTRAWRGRTRWYAKNPEWKVTSPAAPRREEVYIMVKSSIPHASHTLYSLVYINSPVHSPVPRPAWTEYPGRPPRGGWEGRRQVKSERTRKSDSPVPQISTSLPGPGTTMSGGGPAGQENPHSAKRSKHHEQPKDNFFRPHTSENKYKARWAVAAWKSKGHGYASKVVHVTLRPPSNCVGHVKLSSCRDENPDGTCIP